jgi:hypothetical protein
MGVMGVYGVYGVYHGMEGYGVPCHIPYVMGSTMIHRTPHGAYHNGYITMHLTGEDPIMTPLRGLKGSIWVNTHIHGVNNGTTLRGVSGLIRYDMDPFSDHRYTPKGGKSPVNSPCMCSRVSAIGPLIDP